MKLFRPFDMVILIAVMVGVTLFASTRPTEKGARAEVYLDGEKIATFSLDTKERRTEIESSIGTIEIQHGNGAISVQKSPCRQRICILQGEIHHTHERIICLPARMQIVITGKTDSLEGQVDAFSY